MSAKRPAQHNIDEKTLEYVSSNAPAAAKPSSQPVERSIVEVKRDSDGPVTKKPQETAPNAANIQQKDKPMPLFSNLFQNSNNGIGLFGNVGLFNAANAGLQKSQAPKIDFKSSNLFTGNGFSKIGSSSSNLFNLSSNQGTIFGFGQSSIPPVKNGEDEEDGDSAELEKAQNMDVDKSKSKANYDYKEEVKVLFSGIARKFKKNNGDLVENLEIVLQHDEQNGLVYFMVRLLATKNNIFTGYILQNKSQVRVLNKKDQNLQLSAFEIVKGKTAKLHRIKIQLDTPQNGKLLFANLSDAINGNLISRLAQRSQERQKKQDAAKAKEQEQEKKQ